MNSGKIKANFLFFNGVYEKNEYHLLLSVKCYFENISLILSLLTMKNLCSFVDEKN